MAFLSILAGLQELALRTLQELADTTTACSNAMNALDEAKADKADTDFFECITHNSSSPF